MSTYHKVAFTDDEVKMIYNGMERLLASPIAGQFIKLADFARWCGYERDQGVYAVSGAFRFLADEKPEWVQRVLSGQQGLTGRYRVLDKPSSVEALRAALPARERSHRGPGPVAQLNDRLGRMEERVGRLEDLLRGYGVMDR